MRSRLLACAVAGASLLALALPAFAAAPAKNSHFAGVPNKGNHQQQTPTFDTDKAGKNVVYFSYFNDCSPVPVITSFKMKIHAGKFSYKGTVTNVIHKKIAVKISGTFTTAKLAKGKVGYSAVGGKSCPVASFTAKRTGKAAGQQF